MILVGWTPASKTNGEFCIQGRLATSADRTLFTDFSFSHGPCSCFLNEIAISIFGVLFQKNRPAYTCLKLYSK